MNATYFPNSVLGGGLKGAAVFRWTKVGQNEIWVTMSGHTLFSCKDTLSRLDVHKIRFLI